MNKKAMSVVGTLVIAVATILIISVIFGPKIKIAIQKSVSTFIAGEEYCEAVDKTIYEFEEEIDSLMQQASAAGVSPNQRLTLDSRLSVSFENFKQCFPEKFVEKEQEIINTLVNFIIASYSLTQPLRFTLNLQEATATALLLQQHLNIDLMTPLKDRMKINIINLFVKPTLAYATVEGVQPFFSKPDAIDNDRFQQNLVMKYWFAAIMIYQQESPIIRVFFQRPEGQSPPGIDFDRQVAQNIDNSLKYFLWQSVGWSDNPEDIDPDTFYVNMCSPSTVVQTDPTPVDDPMGQINNFIRRARFTDPLGSLTDLLDVCTFPLGWLANHPLRNAYVTQFDAKLRYDPVQVLLWVESARGRGDENAIIAYLRSLKTKAVGDSQIARRVDAKLLESRNIVLEMSRRGDHARAVPLLLQLKQLFLGSSEEAEILYRLIRGFKSLRPPQDPGEFTRELLQKFGTNTNPIMQTFVAEAHFTLGDFDEALQTIDAAFPELVVFERAEPLLLKADIFRQQQKTTEERQTLEQIIREFELYNVPYVQAIVTNARSRLGQPTPASQSQACPVPDRMYANKDACQAACVGKCGQLETNPNCWACSCSQQDFSTENSCLASPCQTCRRSVIPLIFGPREFNLICFTCG